MDSYEEEGSFVNIASDEDGDVMELPQEKDGKVLLSTVQSQFPDAIGLKYKSSTGGWRGIRADDNVLDAPYGGWGETTYIVTKSAALKRKSTSNQGDGSTEKILKSKSKDLLQDLIVLGLPFSTKDEELEEYFTKNCGELAFHEVKYDRQTSKPRGFAFIRFKTEEASLEALKGTHIMEGRKLEIRMSKKKENPMKIFVGRLPTGATKDDVTEYFSDFGDLDDVFVPTPSRGFAFVTFSSQEDARTVLRASHTMKGSRLNVTPAEPKPDERARGQDNFRGRDNPREQGNFRQQESFREQDNFRGRDNFRVQENPRGGDKFQNSDYSWKSNHGAESHGQDRRAPQDAPTRGVDIDELKRIVVAETQKPQGGESFQGQNSYQSNPQASNYSWRSGADRNNDRHSGTPYQQNDPYDSRTAQTPPSKDLSSELKSMLYTLLSSQK